MRVNAEGRVAVTYYDFRDLKNETATLPTSLWFTTSPIGGQNFGAEERLAGPFDMKTAPISEGEGYFIGDYSGLDARGTAFVPFFVLTNSGNTANRTDVFVTSP